MIIAIRDNSDIPIYIQIRDQIVTGISSGKLKEGDTLPTVRSLSSEIGVNTMTVSKAYQLLKQEGYIQTDRRNGARISSSFSTVRGLSQESTSLLQRIASESKISGISENDFIDLCHKAYKGETL